MTGKQLAKVFRRAQVYLAAADGKHPDGPRAHIGCCAAIMLVGGSTPYTPDTPARRAFYAMYTDGTPRLGGFMYWWNEDGCNYTKLTQQERFIALELAACVAETGDLP